MHRTSSFRRIGRRLLAAAAAALLGASPALGGPLSSTAAGCQDRALGHPFVPWGDLAGYVLAPDGIVEGGERWSLAGGATFAQGNETFYVHGRNEVFSLSLPTGSSATTAPMCVGLEHPTLRAFARNRGSALSLLRVEVLFEDAGGRVHALKVGTLLSGPGWRPTPPIPVLANLLPLLPGGRTAVAFRFIPQAGGRWSIDDVYVDPWRHG